MIVYDARKLGGYDIFLHAKGSALYSAKTLPIAFASALLATVFAYAPVLRTWTEAHVLQSTSYFGSISFIVGFTVVYRSQIAYERYAAAQLAYFNMASKMHDFISFTNAFLLDNDERTLVIRDTLVRWARAYHELALDEFQGTEFIPLDRANLTPEEIELLMRDRKRPIQVSSWMHRLIMENRKCFKAGDAILSRAFQIQTNANMYFNNVRRIAETPFPFPFVQLTSVMIHIWAILTPIVTAAFFPQSYILAGAIAGASTWILFGVNETAAQLELPFEPSANNLPVVYYTVAFDDDMSAVQYMQVPEVFECCRMNDFTTLKAKSALAGDATRTSGPGPDHDAHLPSLHHEPNRAASDVAPDSNSIMSKFRFRNKLDAIMEPEKEDPSSPQLRPRSPNANGGPLRTESVGSDGINVSRQGSGSKLFDLFSLNRDDILRESGGAKTEENDDPSDSETESASGAKSSGGSVKDYENRQRALSTNTSPGVKRLNELSKEAAADGDANTSSDEIRLNISNSKEASKEGAASEDSNDVIQLPRRSSLPNSGLALDDSAIETRIRNRHDEPDNSVAPGERRLIESMDSRAVLYHTVHGAEAKRMAQDLQIEREIQRRAVANRALALQIRVDRQRYDMRHHLRDVPSLNAENYHAGHNHNTLGSRSLDEIFEGRDLVSGSISRSSAGPTETEPPAPNDDASLPRRNSSSRPSSHHTDHETIRSYNTLRRRLLGSSRKVGRNDVNNWPGWTTKSLACSRTQGFFKVFY